jgi:hypothetical protein
VPCLCFMTAKKMAKDERESATSSRGLGPFLVMNKNGP